MQMWPPAHDNMLEYRMCVKWRHQVLKLFQPLAAAGALDAGGGHDAHAAAAHDMMFG